MLSVNWFLFPIKNIPGMNPILSDKMGLETVELWKESIFRQTNPKDEKITNTPLFG